MKIKLILTRSAHDPVSEWTEIKIIPVEIPLERQNDGQYPWQVIGAEWPEVEHD